MNKRQLLFFIYFLLGICLIFTISFFVMILVNNIWSNIFSFFPFIGSIVSSFIAGMFTQKLYYKNNKENGGK